MGVVQSTTIIVVCALVDNAVPGREFSQWSYQVPGIDLLPYQSKNGTQQKHSNSGPARENALPFAHKKRCTRTDSIPLAFSFKSLVVFVRLHTFYFLPSVAVVVIVKPPNNDASE